MKNILVIEPSGKLYGSEMVLLDILRNKRNSEISYFVVLPPKASFIKELKKINVKYIDILNIHNGLILKYISYLRLFLFAVRFKFDSFFINQAGILRIASLLSRIRKTPIICEVSTLEDGILVNNMNNSHFKNVKSFISNSEFIANNLNVPEIKKSVLYYGYQWKNLNPVIRNKIEPFNIVLLGRISESKGHFLLVEALSKIKNREPFDIKVYFVGDAPSKKIDQQIKEFIIKKQLEDVFIFRGFQLDIEKELSNKNLMVIPSLREPFGRILCETAEAKLPAIVADSGGLGELSKKFNIGIRFQGNNSMDLAKKIEYVISNYSTINSNFEKSASKMLKTLQMEEYIINIETIIINAINNHNSNIKWFGIDNNSEDKS